jgi:hypothetical protein
MPFRISCQYISIFYYFNAYIDIFIFNKLTAES